MNRFYFLFAFWDKVGRMTYLIDGWAVFFLMRFKNDNVFNFAAERKNRSYVWQNCVWRKEEEFMMSFCSSVESLNLWKILIIIFSWSLKCFVDNRNKTEIQFSTFYQAFKSENFELWSKSKPSKGFEIKCFKWNSKVLLKTLKIREWSFSY